MQINIRKILIISTLVFPVLLSGCQWFTPTLLNNPEESHTPNPATSTLTATATATNTESPTHTPTIATPEPTDTPTIIPSATWVYNEPGQVVAPILLYHHVSGDKYRSRYYVSVPDFQAQMQALYDGGYTAVTISQLLDALIEGAELPEKPIVITFDDGHMSVYENAFPIMESFGFPGVFYIVANRINNSDGFVDIEKITEMISAGWEIGSHGYTHADVTLNPDAAYFEIAQSRVALEQALSTDIKTFAYPFGKIDPVSAQKVSQYGYRAGMGLGTKIIHRFDTLLYMHRIEVYGEYTLDDFLMRIDP